MARCIFQVTSPQGVWQACREAAPAGPYCARHHALCDNALRLVSTTIASPSVRMYYIGLTHWGDQRFYGTKNKVYRPVFVAGLLGPANAGLGPAEAVSLEKFLQDKCKLGDKRHMLYQKYDPDKRDLPYYASLGASPTRYTDPIWSVYAACATAESQKNAPVRTRTASVLTDADKRACPSSQAERRTVPHRLATPCGRTGICRPCGIGHAQQNYHRLSELSRR